MRMVGIGLLGMGLAFLVGCQNQGGLQEENLALQQRNKELAERVKAAESRPAVAGDNGQVQKLQADLAARDQEIARLRDAKMPPVVEATPKGSAEFGGMNVTTDPRTGNLTVNIPGDVLFDSGKAVLKESAKAKLMQIAATLKKTYSGKTILVQGHTDSDPISRTKDQYQDNLDLSAERARAVSAYLVDKGGLGAKHVKPIAMGDAIPKGGKDTSRRVDIVVLMK